MKMSHCVPSWDLGENPTPPRRLTTATDAALRPQSNNSNSNSNSLAPDFTMLDYDVAELTWENGQLSMHGLGPPRVPNKLAPTASPTWDKPCAGGTLESIVNQATCLPHCKAASDCGGAVDKGNDLVPWFDRHRHRHRHQATTAGQMAMDALVPCSTGVQEQVGACVVGCSSSTPAGSCSGANTFDNGGDDVGMKRARVVRAPVAAVADWSSRDNSVSVSGSATFGRGSSRQLGLDAHERELGACGGLTSNSMGSPENTSSAKQCTKATTTTTTEEHDSVCHSRSQREAGEEEDRKKTTGKSSVSTNKRSRAAAIHNQSERKRRDKINQRMKTLQKMVPNSSKTDKASMLDEVIEYLKQLQAQVQMMSRMNMSSMMMPMTLQQQLQLSMMAAAPMGMGMGMGMGMAGVMDMNAIGRPNIAGIPPILHPAAAAAAAFMPLAPWDVSGGERLSTHTSVLPDPMAAFLACQSQPINMDAYSRMAALYQQLHQPQPSGSNKN